MKDIKRSLSSSIVSLVLCFVMLVGSTFAWFTDTATSEDNIIQTGKLDIGMYWSDNNQDWHNTEGDSATPIFNYDNWEPGYTEVRYIKVTNDGSLAFKYHMLLSPNGTVGKLAEVIDVSYDIVSGNTAFAAPTASDKQGSLTKVGTLKDLISNNGAVAGGVLLPESQSADGYYSGEIVVCISFHMQENAGNDYQDSSIGATFNINLYATQFDFEEDSFDSSYDDGAEWPEIPTESTPSTPINVNSEGILAENTTVTNNDGSISATLPAGVKFEAGVNATNLTVQRMTISGANITVGENEESRSYDIHVEGISDDNTVPVAIVVKEFLPIGLNLGNYSLYHVENGNTVAMTLIDDAASAAHNTFTYDPLTGDVTLYMATFSEIALLADTDNPWTGSVDHSWYVNAVAPIYEDVPITYYIANADQLWSFSQIVGGMARYNFGDGEEAIPADTFEGKIVVLASNINLGDTDEYYPDASENGFVFYPIGYYNSEGTYKKTGTAITSGFKLFKGTFDGNGFTIANFYQNTWEMKGDHNWYAPEDQYYRDGMGLFGRVYGGTIKNLTINNFSCDGEITTTGCVAAYADHGALFENIAVINSNPRVYNIGNGGIVGVVGWYEKEQTDLKVTFRNITVDNTNKISALWGSWDVPCGGIVGTYYPTSGQSSAGYPENPGISFENCHVGAQIDVNNDVCANYQYYAYRYAGMLMGMVYENVNGSDGRVYPKMDGIVASDCTIHFGTWNDYYYCELVDNSTASYTHDYQMSRLVEVKEVNGTTITYLDGTIGTVPSSGRANYVVVDYEKGHGDENAQCYHFKDGEVWTHEMGGTEVIDGVEVLKEDKQHLYLEFNNLVTGNGWGVTSKEIGELDGVIILDRTEANSVEKFVGRVNKAGKLVYPISGREYKMSHIFSLVEDLDVRVVPGALTVTVTNLDDDGDVSAVFVRSLTSWADSTLTFSGNGNARITIQDYFYCKTTSIDVTVRNYPEGSIILNFTYDGFDSNEDYQFPESADEITTGKHGTYDYDFGFGPEVLDHALKIDSKGWVGFHATADGNIAIALASNTVGTSLHYKIIPDGQDEKTIEDTEFVKIYEANKLIIMSIPVEAGNTYKFIKGVGETAIYYIGYLPESASGAKHDCAYYEKTTATCTTEGVTTKTCLVCGKYETHDEPALGHHVVVDEAYDSTCTSKGRTEGKHCVNCDSKDPEVYTAQEEIKKRPHNFINDICTGCGGFAANLHTFENGVCTGCQAKEEDVENSEYSYVITHKIDFTTGKAGDYSEYRTCFLPRGICTFDGTSKYVIMKSVDGSPAYIEFTTEYPTTLIVKAASTNRTNTSSFELIDAEGNVIDELNDRVDAVGVDGTTFLYTISKPGTYRFVCTELDRVGRLMSMALAENHSYTSEEIIKAATCTEDGERKLSCSCGKFITEVIPAGHSYSETITKEATCTVEGVKTLTCTVCGDTKTESIPVIEHNYVNGKCSGCNADEPAAGSQVHNFTDNGSTDPEGFFTFTGSTAKDKGTVNYNGSNYGICLKMNSSASVTFTPEANGTVTLVFNTSCNGFTIFINGANSTTIPDDGIVTINVNAGTTYTITKNKSESFLYYVEYVPSN